MLNKNDLVRLFLILLVAVATTGCASMNKKIRAMFGKSTREEAIADARPSTPRFSETDNYKIGAERQYKRMNREQFEAEAQVGDTAGSLWVMEGQGAYLFAQNTKRLVGDLVNINIEGPPQQQLQTKSNVISKLLKRLERGDGPSLRAPASTQGDGQGAGQAAAGQAGAADAAQAATQTPAVGQAAAGAEGTPKANDSGFDVTQVPARIVETLKDGSYRVKGSQQFMIGKREYKVIVAGIIRPEDFNEEGTSATKILDGQFDIVSNKKGISSL